MNESGPQNQEQTVSSYESKVKKGYSELGKDGVEIKNWGTMIDPSGEKFNGYANTVFIKDSFMEPIFRSIEDGKHRVVIADLGGDDGYLLNEVMTGLRDKSPGVDASGLVIDIDSTGKARQKFSEKQLSGDRLGIQYVVADITKLPLADESLDVVMSRMALQYLDQEQQEQLYAEMCRVLKKDGLCIIQTVTSETNNKGFNEFFTKITALIAKSSDFKRSFPSFGEYTSYGRFFEAHGLMPIFGTTLVKFPFSVPAFVERFNVDTKELCELYETESRLHPELFETIDGELCLKARLLNLRLKKVDSVKGFFQKERESRNKF